MNDFICYERSGQNKKESYREKNKLEYYFIRCLKFIQTNIYLLSKPFLY